MSLEILLKKIADKLALVDILCFKFCSICFGIHAQCMLMCDNDKLAFISFILMAFGFGILF